MTKSKIRGIFREFKIQVSGDSYDLIEDHMHRVVKNMATRCKRGNIQRLTPELFYMAIGNLKKG